jgi:hypothetical protein
MIQVTIRETLLKCGATDITNVRVGRDMKYYFSYQGDKFSINLVRGETNNKFKLCWLSPTTSQPVCHWVRVVGCNLHGRMDKTYLAEAIESLINEVDEDA